VLLVEGRECAAIRRTESAVIEDDDPPTESGPAPAPARLTVTSLDVFIPFPGGDGSARTLLLSFRTPVEAVADPMMMLFEAITESLRWRWE
jgi:hypothetical protein